MINIDVKKVLQTRYGKMGAALLAIWALNNVFVALGVGVAVGYLVARRRSAAPAAPAEASKPSSKPELESAPTAQPVSGTPAPAEYKTDMDALLLCRVIEAQGFEAEAVDKTTYRTPAPAEIIERANEALRGMGFKSSAKKVRALRAACPHR